MVDLLDYRIGQRMVDILAIVFWWWNGTLLSLLWFVAGKKNLKLRRVGILAEENQGKRRKLEEVFS